MKFLLHGNAPTVPTGYGVQIGQLGERLRAAGHEVAFSSTFGVQGAPGTWKGMTVYQCGYDINSNDLLHSHADHFFNGDHTGWIITCIDVWAMVSPRLADYNVAAWTPIDHFPIQPGVEQFFESSGAVPVAMSEFGRDLFLERGMDAAYIPLTVDTNIYKPTPTVLTNGKAISGRELFNVPEDAFVVGMVAMNKGWARDRKGFNEAFWAMGQFMRNHPEVVLYMHTEKWGGAEGVNLVNLAIQCGIQEHRLIWAGGPDQYAFRIGYTPQMMALSYSMFDVLLAPSHGEGFCVPLIEAQACGTPVIATDYTAQHELIGDGWRVSWQPEWDPAHHACYVTPFITDIVDQLENAYTADRESMVAGSVEFAGRYDCDRVFAEYWVPFIESLSAPGQKLSADREPMPEENAVAVLVPVLNRPENVAPLIESFKATTDPNEARLIFLYEYPDIEEERAITAAGAEGIQHSTAHTFAEKLNIGFGMTTEPWVLCIGDDVRFHEGWLDQARKLSTEFDVIGTNDTAGKVKNPKVANGSHADHFFVRRAYVEEHGACLDGPGVLAPECYRHWYTDMEIIKLAKARGVFTPCLDSIVEHVHPGFDGREDLRQADPTYMLAVKYQEEDLETFKDRVPLMEMARTTRGACPLKRRIVDAFMILDELDLLECRFRELWEDVDRFVVCEADRTFQGDPKPLFFAENRERFAEFDDKIIHHVAELPPVTNTWHRENVQRDSIADALGFMDDSDLLMLSDVDEIPTTSFVRKARMATRPIVSGQRFFSFAVNWEHPQRWEGTVAIPAPLVRSIAVLRYARTKFLVERESGWHFSWLGNTDRKLHSFAHDELIEPVTTFGLDRHYREGWHVDGTKLIPVTVDDTWPHWIADKQCPTEWFRP